MKFKVGDIVKVRKGLPSNDYIPGCRIFINEKMKDYEGQFTTIADIRTTDDSYALSVDKMHWTWPIEALEDLVYPFKPGDKVMCVNFEGAEATFNKGQIYTVKDCWLAHSLDINSTFFLSFESGKKGWFARRFVLVDEKKLTPKTSVDPAPKDDMVQHPKHYTQGGIECIDAIEAAIKGLPAVYALLTGQIIRYMWRWFWKGKPLEDLEKAKFYLERLISKVKEEQK